MREFRGPALWGGTGKRSVQAHSTRQSAPADNAPATDTDATDAAKALAAEHGIRLEDVIGTGVDGRITKDDVQQHIEDTTEPEPEAPAVALDEPLELIPDEADTPAAETA